MTTKNSNVIFIDQDEWTHKYPKAFRSLRKQREKQFVRFLSGEGIYAEEINVYETLWEKTEHLCAKLSLDIAAYKEMLQKEKLDILAISTNVKGRAELTVLAVEYGAKGIMTEKPMAYSLEETDQMVEVCKNAGVPLVCGSTSASHPSMASAKQLIQDGAIGEVLSYDISSNTNLSQHQNWSYFIDSPAAWVIATGDEEKRESGSAEFRGEGMLVTESGQVVHFRKGGPMMRVTGTEGEIYKRGAYTTWHLAKDIKRSSLSGVNLPENQSYKVDRVVLIRDGKLSTEITRQKSVNDGNELEEFIIVDGSGRVQVPKALLDRTKIKRRAKVRIDDKGVILEPGDGSK